MALLPITSSLKKRMPSKRIVFSCSEHKRVFLGGWRPIEEINPQGLTLYETACDTCEETARTVLRQQYPHLQFRV